MLLVDGKLLLKLVLNKRIKPNASAVEHLCKNLEAEKIFDGTQRANVAQLKQQMSAF